MPNLLPDWMPWIHPAGRLIWFSLITVLGLAVVFVLLRRPKPEEPPTWAQCIAGAVGIFALMTLSYGVLPHEWITFSDSYLRWDTSTFLVDTYAIKVDYQALRDVVATGIYGVAFGLNLFLFAKWQQRPTHAEVAATAEAGDEAPVTGTSRFGRPLRSKA